MADITDISQIAKPIPQQILIEVVGGQARISISGLAPLQVIMLMAQFVGVIASEMKKNEGPARLVVPGVMR